MCYDLFVGSSSFWLSQFGNIFVKSEFFIAILILYCVTISVVISGRSSQPRTLLVYGIETCRANVSLHIFEDV